ncbi:MAG TPA: PAS domain-containing protein [Coleofasciculaceae cyanobacterium]|jgi:hypothetical protein
MTIRGNFGHPYLHSLSSGLEASVAGQIVAIYMGIGFVWSLCSDRLLNIFSYHQNDNFSQLQTLKGGFDVIVTAGIIYWLINREAKATLLANTRLKRTLADLLDSRKELQASQRQFAAFMDNSPAAAWITDFQGRIKYTTKSYLKMFHVPSDLVGQSIFELYPQDVAQAYLDNIQTVANTRQVMEVIEPGVRSDGQPGQFLVYKFPLSQPDGHVHVGGVAIDITERKAREEEFKALADNTPDIITRFDYRLRHLYVNPAMTQATGWPSQHFIGKTNEELGMPEAQLLMWNTTFSRVLITGEQKQLEFQFLTPEGLRDFEARCVPEFAADGTVASVLVIARDMTDQKQLERALRYSRSKVSIERKAQGLPVCSSTQYSKHLKPLRSLSQLNVSLPK